MFGKKENKVRKKKIENVAKNMSRKMCRKFRPIRGFLPFVKMIWKQKQMEVPTMLGSRIRKFYRIRILIFFVTKNDILRFSGFDLIK